MRYIETVFRELVRSGRLLVYLDDLLIATETIAENLEIIKSVLIACNNNLLELREDKCFFLQSRITYLGCVVNKDGVRPGPANVAAVTQFPIPKSTADVHSFAELVSYFRKFIENFSILAAPLYVLRKRAQFKFGEKESQVFELLKNKLVQMPILALYSPSAETEVHCDASALGYGVILLQKQKYGLMHPVFYYSKRTTEVEAKYHSYELECLALVYAVERFHVYLNGIKFKVFTDCESFKLTMNKKDMNPRIARWAFLFQNYDFSIEHRAGSRMKHVDALSRNTNILMRYENTFEQTLSIKQIEDKDIDKLKERLKKCEDKYFKMRNGLVYRKYKSELLF